MHIMGCAARRRAGGECSNEERFARGLLQENLGDGILLAEGGYARATTSGIQLHGALRGPSQRDPAFKGLRGLVGDEVEVAVVELAPDKLQAGIGHRLVAGVSCLE